MKKILILLLVIFYTSVIGQTFDGGLSVKSGIGYLAVKDEFISKEKYSGSAPMFVIDWSRTSADYKHKISFEILSSAKIKNNNVSANVSELSLNISYLHSIGNISLLGKKINLFLGPMPEFFIHYRRQNIADGALAFLDVYSFATLISFSGRFNFNSKLSEKLIFDGNFQTNLISLGGKFIDPNDNDNSMIKFSTLFSNIHFSFDASLKYKISSLLSVSGGYKFNLLNMNSWDYLISANDNLFASLTLSF